MKKMAIILVVILFGGCATNRCGITEKYEDVAMIYAVDSTSRMQESPANPGTFLKVYDTVRIEVKNSMVNNSWKTSYKILKD